MFLWGKCITKIEELSLFSYSGLSWEYSRFQRKFCQKIIEDLKKLLSHQSGQMVVLRRITAASCSALVKPQRHGLLARNPWFRIVGAPTVSLEAAALCVCPGWPKKEGINRFLQKLRFLGRLWGDEEGWYKVILECKEFLWIEFCGSWSLTALLSSEI